MQGVPHDFPRSVLDVPPRLAFQLPSTPLARTPFPSASVPAELDVRRSMKTVLLWVLPIVLGISVAVVGILLASSNPELRTGIQNNLGKLSLFAGFAVFCTVHVFFVVMYINFCDGKKSE